MRSAFVPFLSLQLYALVAVLAGCEMMRPPEEEPELRPTIEIPAEHWTKHSYGFGGTGTAYVHHDEIEDETGTVMPVHWVYDGRFRLLGYYTAFGRTFRLRADDALVDLGAFPPNESILLLVGGSQPIYEVELTRPEIVESGEAVEGGGEGE